MEAMDEKAYKNYKRRIAQAVAKVDNSPPRFNVANYYKTRDLTIDANRVREIDRENMVTAEENEPYYSIRSEYKTHFP